MCSSCLVLLNSLNSDFSSAQGHLFLTYFRTAFHLFALPWSLDKRREYSMLVGMPLSSKAWPLSSFHAYLQEKVNF